MCTKIVYNDFRPYFIVFMLLEAIYNEKSNLS